jgi:hypothetical protein
MTISPTIINCGFREDGAVVVPISGTSQWKTVIDAGGPAVQDNSGTILNPDTHITHASRHIFRRERGQGTTLLLRLGRLPAAVVSAAPVVSVYGRTAVYATDGSVESADEWGLLLTKGGEQTGTLAVTDDDAENATLKFTSPDAEDNAWDSLGCNEFIPGIVTALAADETSTSIIQAKFL